MTFKQSHLSMCMVNESKWEGKGTEQLPQNLPHSRAAHVYKLIVVKERATRVRAH